MLLVNRFQFQQIAGCTEVVLGEGRVRMRRPGTELATILAPGEHGWWTAGAAAFQKSPTNPAKAMAWTRGRLLFEDVPLTTAAARSEEHTSELQSLMRNSYAVFCLKKKNTHKKQHSSITRNKLH